MAGRYGKVFDFPDWAAAFLRAVSPAVGAGQVGRAGGRSAHVRALIAADVQQSFARTRGYGDRRLLAQTRRVAVVRAERYERIALQLPPDYRTVLIARCAALGLTQAEYIVALLVTDGARRGIDVDSFRVRN
jgi:hypothetical protein